MMWEKAPEELVEFLDDTMKDFSPVVERKLIFGYPCYFINGNIFAGLHQDKLVIRLPKEDRDEILAQYNEIALFEPLEGWVMKDLIAVPPQLQKDTEEFRAWMQRAFDYVSSLAPKRPRSRRRQANS